MMVYHAGMLHVLTRCCQKRDRLPSDLMYNVVRRHSCSTSSTTSDKVWEIIKQTLVCVSIHLDCWLNKTRVEIVTCPGCCRCGTPTAIQLSFGFKILAVCTEFNSHSNRIKCVRDFTHNGYTCTYM